MEASNWNAAHPPGSDGVPIRLFTDEDPATTIKGMGFKDAAAAKRTIELATQQGVRYKMYWSIRAMAERAQRHPAQTASMREAIRIFDEWLRVRPSQTGPAAEEIYAERQQRALLARSRANAHALSRCASSEEFNAFATSDRRDCASRLRAAIPGRKFAMPATSFVSVFGGPAKHGFGLHACAEARARGLPASRCTCAFEGKHVITVDDAGDLPLGRGFPWQRFELVVTLNGADGTALLTALPPSDAQPTLSSLLRVGPTPPSSWVCTPSAESSSSASAVGSSTAQALPESSLPASSTVAAALPASVPLPPSAAPYTEASTSETSERVGGGGVGEGTVCGALHVVLLRRDLRTRDQPALRRAADAAAADATSRLLVCYVYDPALLRHPATSTGHFFFIDDCLAQVERELSEYGSALFVRSGHLLGVLESFRRLAAGSAMSLWSNRVVGVATEKARDAQTRDWCRSHSVAWHDLPSNGVIPREDCSAAAWQSDEFQGVWSRHVEEHCTAEEENLVCSRLPPPPEGLSRGSRLKMEAVARLGASTEHGLVRERCQRGGSRAGEELLRSFLAQRSFGYRSKLSSPVTADTACSRLSPHLAWGSLSLRHVHRQLRARASTLHAQGGPRSEEWLMSIEGFRMRLHWRSHNMQKFESVPEAEEFNIERGYDGLRDESDQSDGALRADETLRWRASAGAAPTASACAGATAGSSASGDGVGSSSGLVAAQAMLSHMSSAAPTSSDLSRRFQDWASGRTGYPLVDACMRSLDATGWLTFRMRCLCVSFACYHLWLHWRRPAIWLARRFLDFEPGIHYCQMQMQAGCAEYVEMRVYNPTKQALEQDPQGSFIRKWCPELRAVPLRYLHEPARMPKAAQRDACCVIGADYPRPIVEHQQAYDRAKHMLQERRNAMGWPSAASATAGGSASRKRHGGAGSVDLRELFAKKSAARCDEGASRSQRPPQAMRAAAVDHFAPSAAGSPSADDRNDVRNETLTRTQLTAAGFPPELARRAASAYPQNVERAADWILSSNEW